MKKAMPGTFSGRLDKLRKQVVDYWEKINNKYLVYVFIHALWLVFLTIILQFTEFVRFDEIGFLKLATIVKYDVLKIDPKPELENTIFIDVSKDLQLVDDRDPAFGNLPAYGGAKTVITDRDKLAQLFLILNKHSDSYRYILCDILFDNHSENDSALGDIIEKTPRLITTAILDNGQLVAPVFKTEYGIVNYLQNASAFTKLPIVYSNGQKSLPAKLYENISGKKFVSHFPFTFSHHRLIFNKVFTEFYIRQADLTRQQKKDRKANLHYLGDLLYNDEQTLFDKYLRDKFIIIGDFSKDLHNTYHGQQPGPLILWDTFLTLKRSPPSPNFMWFVLMYIIYFFISAGIINKLENKTAAIHKKIKMNSLRNFVKKYFSYLGVFILISIFTYITASIIISIFYLVSYLTFVELIIQKREDWKNKKIKEIIEEL